MKTGTQTAAEGQIMTAALVVQNLLDAVTTPLLILLVILLATPLLILLVILLATPLLIHLAEQDHSEATGIHALLPALATDMPELSVSQQ